MEKMVLITFLDAKSLSFSLAAVRNLLTTSLISLTANFTWKLRSSVPVVVGLFLVTLPKWPRNSFHQFSVLIMFQGFDF